MPDMHVLNLSEGPVRNGATRGRVGWDKNKTIMSGQTVRMKTLHFQGEYPMWRGPLPRSTDSTHDPNRTGKLRVSPH